MKNNKHPGIILILAWPQTLCKQAGAWYDNILNKLGIASNHYYKVGHAALVLADGVSGKCHYYDFGRYHAPFGHGRVRSEFTDHDLHIPIKAQIEGGKLKNIGEIKFFLQNNESCHGTGDIIMSYCEIDFLKAKEKADAMQKNSPIKYGPFEWNGTNCSRFVRTVALSGQPTFLNKLRLLMPPMFTPTPIWNVRAVKPKNEKIENYYHEVHYELRHYPC